MSVPVHHQHISLTGKRVGRAGWYLTDAEHAQGETQAQGGVLDQVRPPGADQGGTLAIAAVVVCRMRVPVFELRPYVSLRSTNEACCVGDWSSYPAMVSDGPGRTV